jgi:hypothetical protein
VYGSGKVRRASVATKEELKQQICESVDRRRTQIEGIRDHILANPESTDQGAAHIFKIAENQTGMMSL